MKVEETEEKKVDSNPPFITMYFRKDAVDPEKIVVTTDFMDSIPVETMFGLCGQAIAGIVHTCTQIGRAKGMSRKKIDEAIMSYLDSEAENLNDEDEES